jgi:hypothetical protein
LSTSSEPRAGEAPRVEGAGGADGSSELGAVLDDAAPAAALSVAVDGGGAAADEPRGHGSPGAADEASGTSASEDAVAAAGRCDCVDAR